jgi:hypothetical protein
MSGDERVFSADLKAMLQELKRVNDRLERLEQSVNASPEPLQQNGDHDGNAAATAWLDETFNEFINDEQHAKTKSTDPMFSSLLETVQQTAPVRTLPMSPDLVEPSDEVQAKDVREVEPERPEPQIDTGTHTWNGAQPPAKSRYIQEYNQSHHWGTVSMPPQELDRHNNNTSWKELEEKVKPDSNSPLSPAEYNQLPSGKVSPATAEGDLMDSNVLDAAMKMVEFRYNRQDLSTSRFNEDFKVCLGKYEQSLSRDESLPESMKIALYLFALPSKFRSFISAKTLRPPATLARLIEDAVVWDSEPPALPPDMGGGRRKRNRSREWGVKADDHARRNKSMSSPARNASPVPPMPSHDFDTESFASSNRSKRITMGRDCEWAASRGCKGQHGPGECWHDPRNQGKAPPYVRRRGRK